MVILRPMTYRICILLILAVVISVKPAAAFWVWTPESGKWENPKYAAKDTPEEQIEYAKDFYEEKNHKAALREFRKLIKYYSLSKEAPVAQYYIGRIMEDLDKHYEAFKAYQKVIDLYPYTEFVDEVIEREYEIAKMFYEGKKIVILGPLKIPAKDKAVEIFKAVAENAPYGKYADKATFYTGMSQKSIADYEKAIMSFKELVDKYPDSELVDEAKYQLAECSKLLSLNPDYDQTPTLIAREEFEEFVEKHPESDMAEEAKEVIDKLKNKEAQNVFNTAQFYEERNKPSSAIIYYEELIQDYADTEWAKKARERLNELKK